MTTVFLRGATPATPDDITPTIPTLADLGQKIHARPYAIALDPLLVDLPIYEKAEKEMTALLDRRGFVHLDPRGNTVLIQRAEIPERNFLLMGVPVVCREA